MGDRWNAEDEYEEQNLLTFQFLLDAREVGSKVDTEYFL